MIRAILSALGTLALAVVVAVPARASTTPGRLAPGAPIAGSLGVQLLGVPVAAAADPLGHLYIIDHLHPGTVIHRRIRVSNTTRSTLPVLFYPAAASIAHGSFLGATGHTPDALSTWTSVSPGARDIPAGGHITVAVTIAVPRDATAGERYAVLWAESRSYPPAGGGITEVTRAGIRVYLSVGPGGAPQSGFTIQSLIARRLPDGRPMVIAAVNNTGGRALDMYGSLQLTSGPGGLRAGPYPANLGVTLGIGETEPVTIALDRRLPDGPWNALVTLHSGLISNSARATITFPTIAASRPPYLAILGLALLLLAVATLSSAIRRRAAVGRRFPA